MNNNLKSAAQRLWHSLMCLMLAASVFACGGADEDADFEDDLEELGQLEQGLNSRQTTGTSRTLGVNRASGVTALVYGQCIPNTSGSDCAVPNTKSITYTVGTDAASVALEVDLNAIKSTLATQSTFTFTKVAGTGVSVAHVANGVVSFGGSTIRKYMSVTWCAGSGGSCVVLNEPVGIPGTYRRQGGGKVQVVIDQGKIGGQCGSFSNSCYHNLAKHAIAAAMYQVVGLGLSSSAFSNGFGTSRAINTATAQIVLPVFQGCLGSNFGTSAQNDMTLTPVGSGNCGAAASGY